MSDADAESFDSEFYSRLWDQLREIFPNCPFSIDCIKNLDELDAVFSEEPVIFIYDDRARSCNYYYHGFSESELAHMRNYTTVRARNNEPITYRQVIQAMIDDPHYHNDIVASDDHHFLEGFDKSPNSDIQFSPSFGS